MIKFTILFFLMFSTILLAFGQKPPSSEKVIWQTRQDRITGISFSPNGKYVFLDKHEKKGGIEVLDALTGQTIAKLAVCDFFARFSTSFDGNFLAAHCEKNGGKTTEVWDVLHSRLLNTISHQSSSALRLALISPDGQRLITEDKSDKVDRPESAYYWSSVSSFYLWDVVSGKKIRILAPKNINRGEDSQHAAFSSDSKFVATAYLLGQITIWNAEDGSLFQTLSDPSIKQIGDVKYAHGRVKVIEFTPNGKKLITGGYDSKVKIWDTNSGKLEYTLEHKVSISDIAVSPDSKTVCSVDYFDIIKCWNLNTGKLLQAIESKRSIAAWNNAHFTADGKNVFAKTRNGAVLFNLSSGKEIWHLEKALVEMSLDGKWLLAYRNKTQVLEMFPFPE